MGEPDVVAAAALCEKAGAHGITVHLREDRRHIQDRDVFELRKRITTRLNLEMANAPAIVKIAQKVQPDIVCIVPERRQEVTTEGGLDARRNIASLRKTRERMNDRGIDVSLFVSPDPPQIEAAQQIGAQFIELNTGAFAEARGSRAVRREVKRLQQAAQQAHDLGLRVNAGHGLNSANLRFLRTVPHLEELNIGHSIVSRALVVGLDRAVKELLILCQEFYRQDSRGANQSI